MNFNSSDWIKGKKRIHLIGVSGSGMTPLAEILLDLGHRVSGSDIKPVADRLVKRGLEFTLGHEFLKMDEVDAVVASAAIPDENREWMEAKKRKISRYRRGEVLAQLAQGKKLVAVMGSHGKTTTATLLAQIFHEAGLEPCFYLGGYSPALGVSGAWKKGEWLIAEVDESEGAPAQMKPWAALLLNADHEHVDRYADEKAVVAAYREVLGQVTGPVVVVAKEEKAAMEATMGVKTKVTFGWEKSEADYVGRWEGESANGIQFGVMKSGNDLGRGIQPAKQTTPEALDLQAMLAEMRENGCRAASMEVSSHALEQGRTEGVHFAGAIFTNLGRDHLDYHKTMEAYENAKGKLFEGLTEGAFAAVHQEDPAGVRMGARCRPGVRVVTYGIDRGDVHTKNLRMGMEGSSFLLCTPEGEVPATLPWLGRFNVSNALAAAAAAMQAGFSAEKVAAGLGRAPAVPGRMEKVAHAGEISVLIDYAHTEDAVGAALSTLKPFTRGSLWVVLGAGGDRDPGKRPAMAAMAARWADRIVLTSDNPRSEDPKKILKEMAAGLPKGAFVQVLENRVEAIRAAVLSAAAGDVVLVAPKRRI